MHNLLSLPHTISWYSLYKLISISQSFLPLPYPILKLVSTRKYQDRKYSILLSSIKRNYKPIGIWDSFQQEYARGHSRSFLSLKYPKILSQAKYLRVASIVCMKQFTSRLMLIGAYLSNRWKNFNYGYKKGHALWC